MRVQGSVSTHRGRVRASNEDSNYCDNDVYLYAIADGVGGSQAGETASQVFCNVVGEFRESFREAFARVDVQSARREIIALVERVFQTASERIYRMAEKSLDYHGMATTGLLLAFGPGNAVLGHVGDSRAYLYREDKATRLTVDHTLAQEMMTSGLLEPDEVHSFPHRHVLARAVGQLPTVKVDTVWLDVTDGDSYLLCSDGFYRYFDGPEVPTAMANGVEAAVELANEKGGQDNITVLLVKASGHDKGDDTLDTHSKVVAFQNLFLFRYLTDQELVQVLKIVYEKRYKTDQIVLEEGSLGDEIYLIMSGSVAVIKNDQYLTTLGPGSQFGEVAFMDGLPRSATIQASEPTTLLTINRDDFSNLTRSDPVIATKLLWCFVLNMASRLRGLSASLVEATKKK